MQRIWRSQNLILQRKVQWKQWMVDEHGNMKGGKIWFWPAWSSMASRRCCLDPLAPWRRRSGCSWGTDSCCALSDGSTWLHQIHARACMERHPEGTNRLYYTTEEFCCFFLFFFLKKRKNWSTNTGRPRSAAVGAEGRHRHRLMRQTEIIWMLHILNTIILLSWSSLRPSLPPSPAGAGFPTTSHMWLHNMVNFFI